MLGNVIFAVLLLVEIGFVVMSLLKKSNLKKEKSVVRIGLFALFLLLIISPIIDWDLRWMILGLLLGIQAILGIIVLVRKKENVIAKKSKLIFSCLGQVLLIGVVVLPVLIFPDYAPLMTTGDFSVGTVSYTLTDESRKEYFSEVDANRKVTIQFWYPADQSGQNEMTVEGKFPLVIFSHGAFGYRMSNYSTFQELASNGYIVVSIDHTYHAFMTKQEDGETVIGNIDFMNDAMKAQNGDIAAEEIYQMEQEWMKLRKGDMAFVMDHIKEMTASSGADEVYQSIDIDHIGVLGHSLGGATAAQIGREDGDVDAVVVIDGTMFGEITGFEDGKELITNVPYPRPIMNLYNELHYQEALEKPDEYANMVANNNALDSYQVVIEGSGHMNFTDLPIVSPSLSRLLGTGEVDSRYCIETTNEVILQFFDRNLKSSNVKIPKERRF